MAKSNFETLVVYQISEKLSDQIWNIVINWKYFPQSTVGNQLVRAADSIGANIAEGTSRGTYKDNRRFVRITRASLYETKHWLKRAYRRNLLTKDQIHNLSPLISELAPRLNAYLNSIGNSLVVNYLLQIANQAFTTDNKPHTTYTYSKFNTSLSPKVS